MGTPKILGRNASQTVGNPWIYVPCARGDGPRIPDCRGHHPLDGEVGLQATGEQLQWFVAAYSLAFAAPLLFFGGLADSVRDSHPTAEVLDQALIADSFIYRLCCRGSCL